MAADRDSSPLPTSIVRGLTDKLVERRKGAALELERMVKDLVMLNDYSQIKQVVSALVHDFTLSSSANSRKGGLVGLAATAIALGRPSIGMHLPELVQPVLTCFEDPDARVRYYACESLYNISKVARGAVLVFFNSTFDGLCKLSSDSDSNVRYGAELLDRLMKDIVSENPHFDIDNFILLLRDRIYTQDGFARQFLVSWISFLDSVPDIHMHEHVPEFVDGLFCILGDQRKEIRRMAEDALGELLKEIERHSSAVRYDAMANIIAIHCQSDDKVIQFTALSWMKMFLDLAKRSMMVFSQNILVSILPSVAYDADKAFIRDVAVAVNDRLKKLIIPEDDEDFVTDKIASSKESLSPLLHRKVLGSSSSPQPQHKGQSASSTAPVTSTSTPSTGTEAANTAQTGLKPESPQTGRTSPKRVAQSGKASPKTVPSTTSSQSKEDIEKEKEGGEGGEVEGIEEEVGVARGGARLNLLAVLGVLVPHMKYTQPETRMETLRWLMWLHQQLPKRVYLQAGRLFPALFEILTDQSDRVVCMALHAIAILSTSRACMDIPMDIVLNSSATPTQDATPTRDSNTNQNEKATPTGDKTRASASKGSPVLASGKTPSPSYASSAKPSEGQQVMCLRPCPGNQYFRLFLVELLKMFDRDKTLLDRKGNFIVRQLCVYVDAHAVYCTLAEILYSEENLAFASLMVQVLNQILFTSTELYELRLQLQMLETPESWNLFTTLYRSWCHNPVATMALCLLSQNYKHSSDLIQKFTNIEITASTLKEIDKLVQLLESPIFAFLRLQLLDPSQHAPLVRTLYGLLMLLPQSAAFSSLKQRLSCVPAITAVQQAEGESKRPQRQIPSSVSFSDMLQHFVTTQQRHSLTRRKNASYNFRNNTLGMIR